MNIVIKYNFIIALILGVLSFSSCKSFIPESIDALGEDVNYVIKEFSPTLGRKTIYENAANLSNTSTLPLSFKIVNVRGVDGSPANELTDKFPVKVWKGNYTGDEKSIEEIEAKREVEYHSIFEIGKNSGNIMFWDYGNSNWIKTQPDSCYLFDVEISNSGGRKYARNLRLKPFKERPYEPSQYDASTGLATRAALPPAYVSNLLGEKTGDFIFDIEVYVFKDVENKAPGGTLKISVLDSMNNPIDIKKFKDTDWKGMIHGFNQRFEGEKAVYDVAYPMPLVKYSTKYTTSDGGRARINLRNNRIGFGGFLSQSQLGFDFAIYEEGHWEIQFRFRGESPKFDND
ncbi:DUF5007 domain-containing protein [Sphingobacterium bovistauri]|uniref:DUF5007 domain-containing protein n=1 Tax=Sphingobacterium bovistauri TaxID=2781959 RepID=A0ABS7Z6J0_9SPHI|nr:DUF5007 domain-containing protein [Sphingobacterium bovistauri]MCA5005811.1 DUF5007 domain-containing protein [Sphingobacterium bovistauri]